MAIGLAFPGTSVGLVARSQRDLDATADAVRSAGGSPVPIRADLSSSEGRSRLLLTVADRFGPIDILVNNAATVAPLGPSVGLDVADWAAALELNLLAPVELSLAVLPGMVTRGWGRIVNVSSGVVERAAGMTGWNAYVTSKSALEVHTVDLAAETAGTGVTVNVFRPGTVDTVMQGYVRQQDPGVVGAEVHARFVRAERDGSLRSADDVAAILLEHLAGDESGQVWDVAAAPAARQSRPDR